MRCFLTFTKFMGAHQGIKVATELKFMRGVSGSTPLIFCASELDFYYRMQVITLC